MFVIIYKSAGVCLVHLAQAMSPECATSKEHEVSLPFLPSFIVPTEAKIGKFSDVDYGKSAIVLTDNSGPLELSNSGLRPKQREVRHILIYGR